MSRIKGVLERSLLTADTVKSEAKRRKELERLPNPIKRLAALTLHELALQHPEQIARLIGLEPEAAEKAPCVIGSGADSVVYRIGQNAMKVHKTSIGASPHRQQRIARHKQYRGTVLRNGMPDFTLPATTTVTKHPVYTDVDIVSTTQPYQQDIQDTHLFAYRSAAVDEKQLEKLTSRGFTNQLQEFAQASQQLRDSTGFIPDMLGRANVVTADSSDKLLLIDNQPLDLGRGNGSMASARIDNLAAALRDYN